MLCTNHYSHCDNTWQLDDCDSFHNDQCETCRGEITPTHSVEWTEDGAKKHYHNQPKAIELHEWLSWCDRVSKAAHGKGMFLLITGEGEARKTALACFENGERPDAAVHKIRHQQARELWDQLRDVPVNDDGDTEEEFLHFSAGTDTHDIWHYFEEEFNLSVAKDLMYQSKN